MNVYGPLLRQYALVIIANLNLLGSGLLIAWPSPVLVKLVNSSDNPLPQPITDVEGSWIVSIGFLVGAFSNLITGYVVNKLGRKYTLILAVIPKLIGLISCTFANSLWMLYFGRSILGFSDAFTFTVVPIYASEIASKEIRGALGIILQISCSIGILTMLSMGPFLSYFTLNLICTVVVFITCIPLFLIPDSPYFLYIKGKKDEAKRILTYLRGSEELANEEIKEYEVAFNTERVKIKDMLRSTAVKKAVILVIIIGIGTQATGYNAVTFYLQTVLDSTQTTVSSEIASVIIGIIQLFASLCTIFVMDKYGRKHIICISLTGMSIGLMGMGIFFNVMNNGDKISGVLQYLPLFSLVIVVYCYSAGLGSLMWPLLSELFDGQVRAFGMSIGLFSCTVCIFLSTKFFTSLTLAIGASATYWLFSVNCIIFCLFLMFCVPETKGRSFAEIQMALGHKNIKNNVEVKC